MTGPRTPCRVLAGFWDDQGLVERFTEHGRTGAYSAVEEPGRSRRGDVVEVISRPGHGVQVARCSPSRCTGGPTWPSTSAGGLDDLQANGRKSAAASLQRC
ncbi:MOSC domain-containing protein [Saccharopolyspora sp. NPDC000995]